MTLRNIPIDQNELSRFLCTSAPEVRADPNTGEVRTDRTTGKPVYLVGLMVKVHGERRAYVIDVQVPGEPAGIVEGAPVTVEKLVAAPWDREGRSGITYRAESITPATPTTPPASAPTAEASASGGSGSGRVAGRGGGSS